MVFWNFLLMTTFRHGHCSLVVLIPVWCHFKFMPLVRFIYLSPYICMYSTNFGELLYSVWMMTCHVSFPFWLNILFYSLFLFVYDITLTSVIFSACYFTCNITRFVCCIYTYIYSNRFQLQAHTYLNIIPLSTKWNGFVFTYSSERTTGEVEPLWCLSFNQWVLRHFML